MSKLIVLTLLTLLSSFTLAQTDTVNVKSMIESEGRSVAFTDDVPREATGYDSPWHFSHAIRGGDFVYVSGLIIGADADDSLPITESRFRELTEETFETIQRYLSTLDTSLEDLVKINSFHVLDGSTTELTIAEQSLVIAEAKAKYSREPHPAWTAVGTTGLFAPRGIVEIEFVLFAPLN